MRADLAPDAIQSGGTYPRPQLMRSAWTSLDGEWDFARDPGSVTVRAGARPDDVVFDRRITVPFAPETEASGVHETGYCPVVWYRRTVTRDDLRAAGWSGPTAGDPERSRLLVHFGAVDHKATVWFGGQRVGEHVGGYAPFTIDVTDVVAGSAADDSWELVVRAVDDPLDAQTPRGKQDWHEKPHAIWYHRQTGIWQTVWLEAVPDVYVERLTLTSSITEACVDVEVAVAGPLGGERAVSVDLTFEGVALGSAQATGRGSTLRLRVPVPQLEHGQARDEIWWTPEDPRLINVSVRLETDAPHGKYADVIGSYTGIREVSIAERKLWLNNMPCYIRAVLAQNYWPASGYTAPSAEAMRIEVESVKKLGFNCARVHQKAEDPRFLYWADRLGVMVWAEMGNSYQFGTAAVESLVSQWTELVLRDRSHPSVIVWVPINESWGIQDAPRDPRQQAYARSLADLTRALDSTRPVMTNDGWEHTDSDLWTIHDYEEDPEVLAERYADLPGLLRLLDDAPAGRFLAVGGAEDRGQPFMLSEFGGVRLVGSDDDGQGTWGWCTTYSPEDFREKLVQIFGAIGQSTALAGFCYTQLTDTMQEVNGLLTADREPKIPWMLIKGAVRQ